MSIVVLWDNADKTTILVTVTDTWTWQELKRALEHIADLMHSVLHPVNIIADVQRDMVFPPSGFVENVKQIIKTINKMSSMGTLVLVLGKSSAHELILSAAATYSPPQCSRQVVTTLDEARQVLKSDA